VSKNPWNTINLAFVAQEALGITWIPSHDKLSKKKKKRARQPFWKLL